MKLELLEGSINLKFLIGIMSDTEVQQSFETYLIT